MSIDPVRTGQRRVLLIATILLAWGSVAAALYSQHVLGMQPCPWCVLQRLLFVLLGLFAVLGLFARRLGAGLMALAGLCGMATALWQHFVAAKSASCNLTFADKVMAATRLDTLLPDVFEARASCADAAVNLLGVPYEFWSLGLYAALSAAAVLVIRRAR